MTQTDTRRISNLGEELTVMFLVKRGFSIMGRGLGKIYGEIDIIGQKQRILHFFQINSVSRETKDWPIMREGDRYKPDESVHELDKEKIYQIIKMFLMKQGVQNISWQFHVITVYIDEEAGKSDIQILENVIL